MGGAGGGIVACCWGGGRFNAYFGVSFALFLLSFFVIVLKSFLGSKMGAKKEVFGGQNEVKIHPKT